MSREELEYADKALRDIYCSLSRRVPGWDACGGSGDILVVTRKSSLFYAAARIKALQKRVQAALAQEPSP